MKEESRQLKLGENGEVEEKVRKKGDKKRNKRKDRRVVLVILVLSVLASLGFWLSGGRDQPQGSAAGLPAGRQDATRPAGVLNNEQPKKEGKGFFGEAVYEF